MAAPLTGRVIAVHGSHFLVEIPEGIFNCVTRGKKGGIACNDRVEIKLTGAEGGVIEKTLERDNLLYRSDRFRSKLLAANVDQIFIVTAAVPSPNPDLLNRCLIAAEAADIPACIVVNKTDLPETTDLLAQLKPYEQLGYPLITLAAKQDIEPLRPWLVDKVSILIGASGVGKSTLINQLVPEAEIATREISKALDTGKHTTTNTRLYHLPKGGALIDSPGMQEFGLQHLDSAGLQHAFPEFRPLIGQCRFYNCHHLKEPDCAILGAVEKGEILTERWRCYQALLGELDAPKY
jgi:ribosome biogenesis GTPase